MVASQSVTYALLIYRTLPPSVVLPEAEERAALASHRSLQVEADARGQLHAVARLDDPSRARTVRPRASAHEVTDGPFIETKEWLVGFYVIDCDDEQQAIERARSICPGSGHAVEVRPITWRWQS
jgi:hypothetical protein